MKQVNRGNSLRRFLVVGLLLFGASQIILPDTASAATTIMVNSSSDIVANDGECTLREAIISSNTDAISGGAAGECAAGSGAGDIIEFDITSNEGAGPHTISQTGDMPTVSESVVINGYTETGASENTNPITEAFNGTIMIELDQTNSTFGLVAGATIEVRGFAFTNSVRDGLNSQGDNAIIAGNFFGVSPDGVTDEGNAEHGLVISGNDPTVGGTSPADRNVISGNDTGGGGGTLAGIGIISTGSGATVVGNFIGTAADGVTDLGNSNNGINVNDHTNVIIGGTTTSSRNVISGNGASAVSYGGLSGDSGTGNVLLGNYIGVDRTGLTALANDTSGVGIGINSDGVIVGGMADGARNIISGNTGGGISISGANDTIVQGNYVGISADGNNPIPNSNVAAVGILVAGDNNTIGGTSAAARNIISASTDSAGLYVLGGSGNKIQGNYIGTNVDGEVETGFGNGSFGITILPIFSDASNNVVGGAEQGNGNIIAGNQGGIVVIASSTLETNEISILGNSIHDNSGSLLSSLGIDLMEDTDGDFTPDFNIGVTPNDVGDPDTRANNYLNFPIIDSTNAVAGSLDVQFDLDVDEVAPNGYRIEFFANSTPDASGNGQGEIYLGSKDIAGDVTDEVANLSIPSSFTTGSYAITATTTEIDNSSDGFGSTSEFAGNLDNQTITAATVSQGLGQAELAETGSSSITILRLAGGLMTVGFALVLGKAMQSTLQKY
jgi:CSLREA domain-containing protein